jgi:hypothetical protein
MYMCKMIYSHTHIHDDTQAVGNIAPYAVALLIQPIPSAVWKFRLCLALGSIPPFIVLLSTWGAEESHEYTSANEAQ